MNDTRKELGEKTILDENMQGFQLTNQMDNGSVEILAERDENGDYPILMFNYQIEGVSHKFALQRDELAAITFALARQDQQSKLLTLRFREYKEVPVKLVIEAKKDIKKGDLVICWRKERVPLDFNYSKI